MTYVTISSKVAEYIAASFRSRELFWLKQLFKGSSQLQYLSPCSRVVCKFAKNRFQLPYQPEASTLTSVIVGCGTCWRKGHVLSNKVGASWYRDEAVD